MPAHNCIVNLREIAADLKLAKAEDEILIFNLKS
jgi:hypothetical protein